MNKEQLKLLEKLTKIEQLIKDKIKPGLKSDLSKSITSLELAKICTLCSSLFIELCGGVVKEIKFEKYNALGAVNPFWDKWGNI